MPAARYTIRYRQRTPIGVVALLVEDTDGSFHVVSPQTFLPYRLRRHAPTLRHLGWVPVPAVAPYTRDGLLRLVSPRAA